DLDTLPPAAGTCDTSNVYALAANVAVTLRLALIVTLTGFVEPVTSPLHDTNPYPAGGTAGSATTVPGAELGGPGPRRTDPPTPADVVRVNVKLPKIERLRVRTTVSGLAVPEVSPPHDTNALFASGVAVTVTTVP